MTSFSMTFQPPKVITEWVFGKALLNEGFNYCYTLSDDVIPIVEARFQKQIPQLLNAIYLNGGEEVKTRRVKEDLENRLYKRGCGKKSLLVAIGGGALLDLVGYVAATYCRGISYVSFPTTLLAMTDAAIGGKTGINIQSGKNYSGSFHPPYRIYCDLNWLQTLSQKDWVAGLAESVKHSLITDAHLFEHLEKNFEAIVEHRDLTFIPRSVQIKAKIVEQDPYDQKGIRARLNFGHTIGHAIEAHSEYQIAHGEAVFMGMMVEGFMARHLNLISKPEWECITDLLCRFPLEWAYPQKIPLALMQRDKKGPNRFIALTGIGKTCEMPLEFTETLLNKGWADAVCTTQNRVPVSC